MASNAVGLDRISRVVGYILTAGDFRVISPNLPQRIAVFGEANTENQVDLDTDPHQVTTLQEAGERYGYGSPIYNMVRILLPVNSDSGVGGIPVIVYPQAAPGGATAKVIEITPAGVATANGIHTLRVAGRDNVDGTAYDINIEQGDTTSDITQKIEDAVNNVLGAPVKGASDDYTAELTAKWKGLTSNDIQVSVETNGDDLGISYAINPTAAGSGTPSIATDLDKIGNEWVTFVCNGYGTVNSIMTALEQWNGRPMGNAPTGRYTGITFKPMVAVTGSVAEDPSNITDPRSEQVTIAIAPAPLSEGLPMEAAANMLVLAAVNFQNTPHLDISGQSYPDMPTPKSIGKMAKYSERDVIVKKGCSTVDLVSERYQVQDFVTTYHKLGENPPQYRYVRDLVGVDFNVRYTYLIQEQKHVVDHVIANDDDLVSAPNTIKPKQWKQIVCSEIGDGLVQRGLLVDAAFTKNSVNVVISSSNPNRLETTFKYKRSGTVRIAATTAEAGFNFGSLT